MPHNAAKYGPDDCVTMSSMALATSSTLPQCTHTRSAGNTLRSSMDTPSSVRRTLSARIGSISCTP
jgi:hypothetical protein